MRTFLVRTLSFLFIFVALIALSAHAQADESGENTAEISSQATKHSYPIFLAQLYTYNPLIQKAIKDQPEKRGKKVFIIKIIYDVDRNQALNIHEYLLSYDQCKTWIRSTENPITTEQSELLYTGSPQVDTALIFIDALTLGARLTTDYSDNRVFRGEYRKSDQLSEKGIALYKEYHKYSLAQEVTQQSKIYFLNRILDRFKDNSTELDAFPPLKASYRQNVLINLRKVEGDISKLSDSDQTNLKQIIALLTKQHQQWIETKKILEILPALEKNHIENIDAILIAFGIEA